MVGHWGSNQVLHSYFWGAECTHYTRMKWSPGRILPQLCHIRRLGGPDSLDPAFSTWFPILLPLTRSHEFSLFSKQAPWFSTLGLTFFLSSSLPSFHFSPFLLSTLGMTYIPLNLSVKTGWLKHIYIHLWDHSPDEDTLSIYTHTTLHLPRKFPFQSVFPPRANHCSDFYHNAISMYFFVSVVHIIFLKYIHVIVCIGLFLFAK